MSLLRWSGRGALSAAGWLIVLTGCGSDPDDAEVDAGARDAEVEDGGADADIGDGSVDAQVEPPVSNGGCTGTLELCDIREADCQRSISEEVACLRDAEPVMPVVELLTPAEYLEWFEDLELTPDPSLKHWLNGLATFRLAVANTTPDQGGAQVSEIAASYSQYTKRITIIDRGMPLDDFYAVTTLAHELVHAQRDAEHDVSAWGAQWALNFDRTLAASSVTEGEAVHYEMLVAHALTSVAVDAIDWDALYGQWEQDAYAYFHEVESPFLSAPIVVPYPFGGALATERWRTDGKAGIDALFEDPPRSSRELMFGEADGMAEAEAQLFTAALPTFTVDFRPVRFDALGAYVFREFLRRHGASEESAMRAAEQVGADVFAVLVNRQDATLVSTWRVRLLKGADTSWLDELDLTGFAVLEEFSQITFITGPDDLLAFPEILRWDPVPGPPLP